MNILRGTPKQLIHKIIAEIDLLYHANIELDNSDIKKLQYLRKNIDIILEHYEGLPANQ